MMEVKLLSLSQQVFKDMMKIYQLKENIVRNIISRAMQSK
jgi:hypothetical protein